MRIHSSVLQLPDLYRELPVGVHLNASYKGSRKRERAFEVTLYVTQKDDLHKRFGNSGGYGASGEVAATWDEWGVWIDRLFDLDPEALIGHYKSPAHFVEETQRYYETVQRFNKPGSLAARTHTAPWLEYETVPA